MKKTISIILVTLLIAACSNKNSYSYLSNDEVLFTGPDNYSYSSADLYKSLKNGSEDLILSDILKRIAINNNLVDLEEIEQEAQSFVDQYVSMGYESYIVSSYGSLDAYKEAYVDSLITFNLAKEYVNDNYDSLVSENSPVKMQLAEFATLEEAQKCIEDFNNSSTFDMAAANNNCLYSPESKVYLDTDSSLVYEVKQYINESDTIGISDVITYTTTATGSDDSTTESNSYYVVNIESRNADEFKDDFIEEMAYTIDSNKVQEYFLNKHKVEFFDQDLYKMMSESLGY